MTDIKKPGTGGKLRYFIYKLARLRTQLFAVCIFSLTSYPLLSVAMSLWVDANINVHELRDRLGYDNEATLIAETRNRQLESVLVIALMLALLSVVLLFIMGYVILRKNYRYLFDKVYVDTDMSLPVSDTGRFWGDFFSGLLVYMIPHMISAAVGYAVISSAINRAVAVVYDISAAPLGIMRSAMITGLLMCLLFYCTTLFIINFCGRKLEAAALPFMLNASVTSILLFGSLLSLIGGYGMPDSSLLYEMPDALAVTTPLGLLATFIMRGTNIGTSYRSAEYYIGNLIDAKLAAEIIVFCAALTLLTFLLYKKRRAERVGSSYVFGFVGETVTILEILAVTLPLFCLFIDGTDIYTGKPYLRFTSAGIMAIIVVTLILFVISELRKKKETRSFIKAALRYAAYTGGSLAIAYLLCMHDPAAALYVPAESAVESTGIRLITSGSHYYGAPEDIGPVLRLHKEILEKRPPENVNGCFIELRLEYKLKSGRTMIRFYRLDSGLFKKSFNTLIESRALDLYFKLDDSGIFDPDEVYFTENNYSSIVNSFTDVGYTFTSRSNIRRMARLTDITPSELEDALMKDYQALSFDKLYKSAYLPPKELIVAGEYTGEQAELYKRVEETDCNMRRVCVYPFYENTIALLERHGIELEWELPESEKTYIAKTVVLGGTVSGSTNGYYNEISFFVCSFLICSRVEIQRPPPFPCFLKEAFDLVILNRTDELIQPLRFGFRSGDSSYLMLLSE